MKERPILFSAPMVRAILAGTKTQTRRIVKPQPDEAPGMDCTRLRFKLKDGSECADIAKESTDVCIMCPYGMPCDRLWVRETGWEPSEPSLRELRDGADTWPKYAYDADGISDYEREDFKRWGWKRRPSIFMPRWASRITLEITDVRVERLQEISEADARAEGIYMNADGWFSVVGLIRHGRTLLFRTARECYRALWESINGVTGETSWGANPWVWCISSKRVSQ